jgi:hypothetical protein
MEDCSEEIDFFLCVKVVDVDTFGKKMEEEREKSWRRRKELENRRGLKGRE